MAQVYIEDLFDKEGKPSEIIMKDEHLVNGGIKGTTGRNNSSHKEEQSRWIKWNTSRNVEESRERDIQDGIQEVKKINRQI